MAVKQIIHEMQEVFVQKSRALAVPSGFCQRTSPISSSAWVQGLVFGWLADPNASLSSLARALAVAGASVSPQAVQYRFGEAGAALLRGVLEEMTAYALHDAAQRNRQRSKRKRSEHHSAWLEAFPAIWLRDSTLIPLPAALHDKWPGTGKAKVSAKDQEGKEPKSKVSPSASLKVSVKWEWHSGIIAPLHLTSGLVHDQKAACQQDGIQANLGHGAQCGEMHVFDLGFFALISLAQLHAQGAYFCCRYKAGTHLQRLDKADSGFVTSPLEWLEALPADQEQAEWEVLLGSKARLPVRFLAVRVPPEVALVRRAECLAHNRRKGQKVRQSRLALCDWNLFVTNAPATLLSVPQARVLYGLRWQIERLFRLWKETLQVDEWRSQNPQRILCEVYAKLIGALLTQKLTAFCAWDNPARSLVKCGQTIAGHALGLLTHLRFDSALKRELYALRRACCVAASLESRKQKPATFQRLKQANVA